MPVTPKMPKNLPTMTDWTDDGMGREKSDDKGATDLEKNILGPEYSQMEAELLEIAKKLGTNLTLPTEYGDDESGCVDEILRYLAKRADRADCFEHFTHTSGLGPGIYFVDINSAGTFNQVANACGVYGITCAAATVEGLYQAYDHFHQRYSYFRCRVKISSVPVGAADEIRVGLYRDATHYVQFICTNPSVPTVWTVEVKDGAGSDSDTLTVAPDTDWHVFEIQTSETGADFWLDKDTVDVEHVELTGQAPENGYAHPRGSMISAAGGEAIQFDEIGARDTRTH